MTKKKWIKMISHVAVILQISQKMPKAIKIRKIKKKLRGKLDIYFIGIANLLLSRTKFSNFALIKLVCNSPHNVVTIALCINQWFCVYDKDIGIGISNTLNTNNYSSAKQYFVFNITHHTGWDKTEILLVVRVLYILQSVV